MAESTSSLVECPVCEAEFDPKAAGGWCTNSECGEWRYDGADFPSGGDAEADAGTEPVGSEDSEGDVEPTPAIQKISSDEASGGSEESDDSDGADHTEEEHADSDVDGEKPDHRSERHAVETDDEAADTSPDGVDDTTQSAAEPVEETGSEPAEEGGKDATETATEDDAETAEIDCPACGETLDADANFCPSCGEDVSAVEPEAEDEDDQKLTECPSCSANVGPEDSFCASCGENLDDHRGPDKLTECPSCDTDVDPDDSYCVSCGEDLDVHREGRANAESATGSEESDKTPKGEPAPESLVLAVRGEEIVVSDGDTVGKELRRIITESGGNENDAVRIHREHVQFVRENDQFYLVDLGRNPTRLNDTRMEQDDREPIGPGDELNLSGVVTLAVRAP